MRVDLQRLIRHVEVGTELIGSLVLLERGARGVDDLRRSIRRLLAVDDRADVVTDDARRCEVEIRQHDDDRVVIDESLDNENANVSMHVRRYRKANVSAMQTLALCKR